jgi:RNA polymerase sigma factor (sigma-70 family)
MADRTSLEGTFLQNLPLIERIIASTARRQGFDIDEASELASWIKLRFVENDYAVLGKFRGESSIGTYLTVVIAMLARDYRVQRWGRWRPSSAARQGGPLAIRLESLVVRKGYRLEQAGELLRTTGETTLSDKELAGILTKLPARRPLRPVEVGAAPLVEMESGNRADFLVTEQSAEADRQRTTKALDEALSALPVEDRIVLKMRFWEQMSVAEIARGLGLDQKPLYRRLERLLADLRARLTRAGVTIDELRALMNEAVP